MAPTRPFMSAPTRAAREALDNDCCEETHHHSAITAQLPRDEDSAACIERTFIDLWRQHDNGQDTECRGQSQVYACSNTFRNFGHILGRPLSKISRCFHIHYISRVSKCINGQQCSRHCDKKACLPLCQECCRS